MLNSRATWNYETDLYSWIELANYVFMLPIKLELLPALGISIKPKS